MDRLEKSTIVTVLFGMVCTGFGMFVTNPEPADRAIAIIFGIAAVILIAIITTCCLRPFRLFCNKRQNIV